MENPAIIKSEFVRGPAKTDTSLTRFQKRIEEKYGLKFDTYWELHKWSIENLTEFWTNVWDFLQIIHSEPFTSVLEEGKKFEDIPKWFLGAKLNYAENMLQHPDDDVALILIGEEREEEFVTFGQLKEEVSILSAALRRVGIKKGDVTSSFISNRKEAIVIMLAAASIGALFSTVNPQMGVKAVLTRLHQLSPKVLLSIDRHLYNKEEKNILEILSEIAQGLPSLEHVIIVPSNDCSLKKDISVIPKSVFYPHFLQTGLEPSGRAPLPVYEQLSYNHPFTVNFTSGTTGHPKAIVHSAGAALLGPLKENVFSLDAKRSDVMYTVLATGWVSWNFAVAGLASGATLVIFEGVPFYNYGTLYCEIFNKYKVTHVFFPPSTLEDLQRLNLVPGIENELKSVEIIVSGSAFVKGYIYDFVYDHIKKDVFYSAVYGSTEFMMLVAGVNTALPVYKEEIQVPFLGLDIRCYNEEGEQILDRKGELIIGKPYPYMPLCIWNDDDMHKYKSAFFSRFPGVWYQGDICSINSTTGGMKVHGRSDETINQRGARFGTSEIYCIVNPMNHVSDSICVSWINDEGDEIGVLFVKMKHGRDVTPEFLQELKQAVGNELGEEYVPEKILQVKDIPYNVNGKKMEVLVKKILANAKNLSYDTVLNPECLHEYIAISRSLQKS